MKLLYKELALAAHPTLYVFTLLGGLVMVPSYPFSVIFMFGCLAPFITFTNARENNDAFYTAVLPVRKSDIVKAKFQLILCVQLGQLLVSLPFALLRHGLNFPHNPVGMNPTVAWYGFGLLMYGIFDLVYFPSYYKSGYKAGKSFVLAMIPLVTAMAVSEILPHFPSLAWLASMEAGDQLKQLPILLLGIFCYGFCIYFAYRISAKRFERVDL